mmetsp:Transcript_72436/g.212261  ORF Transcript_72436/g.212261 Transcript_72436/m.212261 type:complete len:250 (+) Transcript_72436:495-1244(+)
MMVLWRRRECLLFCHPVTEVLQLSELPLKLCIPLGHLLFEAQQPLLLGLDGAGLLQLLLVGCCCLLLDGVLHLRSLLAPRCLGATVLGGATHADDHVWRFVSAGAGAACRQRVNATHVHSFGLRERLTATLFDNDHLAHCVWPKQSLLQLTLAAAPAHARRKTLPQQLQPPGQCRPELRHRQATLPQELVGGPGLKGLHAARCQDSHHGQLQIRVPRDRHQQNSSKRDEELRKVVQENHDHALRSCHTA